MCAADLEPRRRRRRASRRRTTPSPGRARPRTRTSPQRAAAAPARVVLGDGGALPDQSAASSTTRSRRYAADAAHGPPVASWHASQWQTITSRTGPSIEKRTAPQGQEPSRVTPAERRAAARDRRRTSTSRTRPGSAPCPGSPARGRRRAWSDSTSSAGSPGARKATSVERSSGVTTSTRAASSSRQRSATAAAWSKRPGRPLSSAASRPASDDAGHQFGSKRAAPGRGSKRPVRLVAGLGEVARRRDPQPLGVGDDERAGRIRAAEPLLARDREEVEAGRIDRDRPDRLRAVDEHGNPGLLAQLAHGQHPPRRPEHLRQRQQARPRRHRGQDRVGLGLDDDHPGARRTEGPSRPKCSSVVVTISSSGPSPSPATHDVAAVRRARRERDLERVGGDERREPARTCSRSSRTRRKYGMPLRPSSKSRSSSACTASWVAARDRPERAGVEVRDPLEHRELRPRLLEGHDAVERRLIGQHDAILHASGCLQGCVTALSDGASRLDARCASSSPTLPPTRRRTTRARRGARAAGSRRPAAHLPLPLRGRAARGRVRGRRQPLRPLGAASAPAAAASPPRRSATRVRSWPARGSPTATSSTSSGSRRRRPTPGSCTRAVPLVFTAHDLLPRRTARHTRTWKRLFGRFDRIVTHSERGRRTLARVRRPRAKLRVIPHPAFHSDPGPGATTAAPCSRSA